MSNDETSQEPLPPLEVKLVKEKEEIPVNTDIDYEDWEFTEKEIDESIKLITEIEKKHGK